MLKWAVSGIQKFQPNYSSTDLTLDSLEQTLEKLGDAYEDSLEKALDITLDSKDKTIENSRDSPIRVSHSDL